MFKDEAFGFVVEALKSAVLRESMVERCDGTRNTGPISESKTMRHGALGQTTVLNQQFHQHGAGIALVATTTHLIHAESANIGDDLLHYLGRNPGLHSPHGDILRRSECGCLRLQLQFDVATELTLPDSLA